MSGKHLGTLKIQDLSVPNASIGVYPHEHASPQPLVFQIEADVDISACASSDSMENAVDYTLLAETVVQVTLSQHYCLVETLCERVAAVLLEKFPLYRVFVGIHKPQALTYGRVSVSVERTA